MLIYIIHSNQFYTFRLPQIVSGNYMIEDFDASGSAKNLINVVAKDSKWIMSSNENVQIIMNNQFTKSCELKLYNWYFLSTLDGEKIIFYTMPSYSNHYVIKAFEKEGKIIFGKDKKCDVFVPYHFFGDQQFELSYMNSKFSIKNLNSKVSLYVNTNRVSEAILESFDSIFVAGLKFVICGNMIFIMDPLQNIEFNTNYLTEPVRSLSVNDYNSAFQNYTDYYSPSEYFAKSPVFFKRNPMVEVELHSPEEKEDFEYESIIMTLVPTALMSILTLISTYYTIHNFRNGEDSEEILVTTVAMLVIMFILCFVWPFVERFVEKMRYHFREKARIKLYKKYLKEKREFLEKLTNEQKASLFFNNISLEECQNAIFNRSANLFSLNPGQEQFLNLRLGTGKVKLNCNLGYQKPDFVKYEDPLQKELEQLVEQYRYINDAPLTFSLKNNITFINSNQEYEKCFSSIVIQIAALHDYHDVKIVAFTSEHSKLSSVGRLNHSWSDDRSIRYVATNMQEAETLSSDLMKIYNQRANGGVDEELLPFYIVICDDINKYRNLKIIDEIIHQKENRGFSFITFAKRITEAPNGCSYFCDYSDNKATLFKSDMSENDSITFVPEFMTMQISFSKCISILANIPVKSNSESIGNAVLPEKLGFLEMYNVGNVDQLNSADRWKNSQIVNSLAAPIGVDSTGNILYLDLHEKKHGPHGLVAGMTGSGKSETIITYLLSLAVNYSPDEVQFVLIDYKGGGLAGAFENRRTGIKLPHLVGTITNLDTSEMNRTLVSIKSELQRRQKIFNKAKEELNTGTIDIYKYQGLVRDGQIKEPLSHLFIVCDEFAELRQQQPDFMDEIVSAARIGRSLGIHLILATQKPSGVVDDQVWSNSRFKICCKVQTAEDSSEMLRKPDAAYIKEAGRFYLQIGYDEYYTLAQSGYSGTEYIPSDRALSKLDNNISFVNTLGEVYRNASFKVVQHEDNHKNSMGEELTNIVRYLIDVAKKENYKYHQLWLDNVPEMLPYSKLIHKYNPVTSVYDINPIIGEFDDPAKQTQGLVTLPITMGGNTFIGGVSGSGKSTLLSTIISSTIINHNSDEVNIYIIDLNSEKLKKFADAPQVGDVLTSASVTELKYLFYMLESELTKRQKYYADTGGDFARDVKNKNCPFPNILVFLYDIDSFKEAYDFFFEETIYPISRNSAKYGIYFIITGTSIGSLGYTAEQNFPQRILLNMADPADYAEFFDQFPIIKKNPGRGVVQIQDGAYEFQTSLFFEEAKEMEYLQNILDQLNACLKTKAPPIPRVPEKVTFDYVEKDITTLDHVPIGFNTATARMEYYNFDRLVTVLSSDQASAFFRFSMTFQKLLLSVPNTKIVILNALEDMKIPAYESAKVYDKGFLKATNILKENILKYNDMSSEEKFIIFVLNFSGLNETLKENKKNEGGEDTTTITDLIHLAQNNQNFRFILYDVAAESDDLRNGEILDFFDGTKGLWLGNSFDGQMLFEVLNFGDIGSSNNDCFVRIEDDMGYEIKAVR